MSLKTYENHLYQRYKFFNSSSPRLRNDTEFPWALIRDNSWNLRTFLKQFKAFRKIYFKLNSSDFTPVGWESISNDMEKLYEVRCMLDDQLSKLLFDETIVLKALTYKKYYSSRYFFDSMAEIVSHEPFKQIGFPDNYLGASLKNLQLKLNVNGNDTLVKMVSTLEYVDLLNSSRQYFIERNNIDLKPQSGDVVFDCGACIGDTSVIFAGLVGSAGKVHAFDPIALHNRFCALQKNLNPELAHVLEFNQIAVGKESIKNNIQVDLENNEIDPGKLKMDNFDYTSLDDYVKNNQLKKVDFIKMDIEGAECDAIVGAEKTIQTFKPRLAISTYHKLDHFWSIPLQIKKLNPGYKFAFGHHSPLNWESVIYAYNN